MSASAELSSVFDVPPEEIPTAVDQALRDIGATSIRWTRQKVTATKSFNFWSWGENLTVRINRFGEVWVHSECSFPLQIVDWGKNYRNCKAFLKAVARRLGIE